MTKFKLLSVLLCILFNSSNALAQMYKWVDKEGNISYSDQPPFKGAEQLDAPALTTMPATAIPKKSPAKAEPEEEDDKKEVTKYTELKITSPQNDATIRDNSGNFSIAFSAKPALDSNFGHYFSVSMDGKVIKNKLTSGSASFSNIDRGTHKISVSVKNKSGKTLLKSKSVTVYLHRQVVIRKQPR